MQVGQGGFGDIVENPSLTKYSDSLERLERLFDDVELLEKGIVLCELLDEMPEQGVMDYLEEQGIVPTVIGAGEIQSLIAQQESKELLDIEFEKMAFFKLRQLEEFSNGQMVDVSAFNTMDYLASTAQFEFDRYQYFTDKVAEKVRNLAIMYSCIADEVCRQTVRGRYMNLVGGKFRNSAIYLLDRMNKLPLSDPMRQEIKEKVDEKVRQIKRLESIWAKYSKWE